MYDNGGVLVGCGRVSGFDIEHKKLSN